MSILIEELKLYQANAGRISSNRVNNGYKNGLFRDITEAERTAGISLTEKLFYKVENNAGTEAVNTRVFIADITPSGGRAVIYSGSQRDTIPSGRKYGAGRLNADIVATATTIVVDAESGAGADLIFQAGDLLFITDLAGNEELVNVGSVSWAGDTATLGISALVNDYVAASPTVISSVIQSASVKATTDAYLVTSAGGIYDDATSPVQNNAIGGVEQTWTLTFTSTADFTVIGDTVGLVGSGNIATAFSPVNPDFAKLYFTLPAAAWSGSWLVNDTLVFETHPAAVPFFVQLIIPPATPEYSNDQVNFGFIVESA